MKSHEVEILNNQTVTEFDWNSINNIEQIDNNISIGERIIASLSHDPGRFGTILTFYGAVIILSLAGNLLVLRTVISKCSRNSTNYLILNLALSDILMTVMNIPITVIDILIHDWSFGYRLCILVPFFQACCVYVSSFTMLTIALNRYYLVYYSRSKTATFLRPSFGPDNRVGGNGRSSIPGNISISIPVIDPLHSRLRRPSTMQTLALGIRSKRWIPSKLSCLPVAIWTLAILHSLPFANNQIITWKSNFKTPVPHFLLRRCVTTDIPFGELTLTLFVFVTQYLFPLVISGAIYLRIGMTISQLGHVLHTSIRVRRAAAAAAAAATASATTSTSITTSSAVSTTAPVTEATRTLTPSSGSETLHLSCLLTATQLATGHGSEPVTPTRSSSNGGIMNREISNSDRCLPFHITHRLSRKEAILVRKRQRILLLTLIVSIFAGCWLPFHIYFLLKDFHLIITNERIFLMCHWLAMSSVCYNPIVYFWLNDSFRGEVKSLMSRFCDFHCRIFAHNRNNTQQFSHEQVHIYNC